MNKIKTQPIKFTESIGPVENLESYVKAEWWQQLFNANYLRTDGDVVEDETITKNELDLFISILKPFKESAILDLCCGQGRHSLELARRGFTNIVGLDRSHYLITRARKLNKQDGGNITFLEIRRNHTCPCQLLKKIIRPYRRICPKYAAMSHNGKNCRDVIFPDVT